MLYPNYGYNFYFFPCTIWVLAFHFNPFHHESCPSTGLESIKLWVLEMYFLSYYHSFITKSLRNNTRINEAPWGLSEKSSLVVPGFDVPKLI